MKFFLIDEIVIVVLVFFLCFSYTKWKCESSLTVTVNEGKLEGKQWKSRNGKVFSAFLSIPYAEPPIANLRFMAPIPAKHWKGIRDAKEDHQVCPQRNIYTRSDLIEGTEDCLYLNVYTPKITTNNVLEDLLPVMVFVHGGGWLCCAGNSIYYGPDILLDKDVVLVVINYRLGPLGFLSTGDEEVPGNNGLKDQSLALKWVKENIDRFGGNPEKITVFGESAGGSSAHFLILSPLTKNLIKGVISQSGNALTSWSLSRFNETQDNSRKLASFLDCPQTPTSAMVECLRKIDSHTIIAQDTKFMMWDTDPMIPFKPVVEPDIKGAFLPEHPVDLIKSGKAADVPWMTGITDGDGALRSAAIFGIKELYQDFRDNLDHALPIALDYYHHPESNKEAVTKKIKEFYFKNLNDLSKDNITNLFTDGWFLEGTDRAVRLHLNYLKSPVFFYLFSYRGTSSYTELFGDPYNDYGACHADELQYLFPVGDVLFPNKKSNEKDKKMAEIMTTLWVNFAKYGNPTPNNDDSSFGIDWNRVTSEDLMEFYSIENQDNVFMKKNLYKERVDFWREYSPFKYDDKISRIVDEL